MNYSTKLASLILSAAALSPIANAATYSQKDFLGLGLGVGIALTADAGRGKDRVESATVINGIVRVEEERSSEARIVLESHYFFKSEKAFPLGNVPASDWGHGPFMVVQPGEREIVNAIGFGWMLGFRRGDPLVPRESWNVGLGVLIDPNAKVLGDGLEKDKPLPAGETNVRYKTEAESSIVLIFSFSY